MPGIRSGPDELERKYYGALPMLAHGGASSPRVRSPLLRNPHGGAVRPRQPGPERLLYRAGRVRAPDPDDRSNVASAVISEVFPAFTAPVTMMSHRLRTAAARNAAVTSSTVPSLIRLDSVTSR